MVALIVELSRQYEPAFPAGCEPDMVEEVRKLANDGRKARAKHDRTKQRACFRDILHFLERNVSPERVIKFGHETLTLDSWCRHHRYNMLRKLFGSGLNVQLKENGLIRDVLDLGPKVDEQSNPYRTTVKSNIRFSPAVTSKERAVARVKHRQEKQSFRLEQEFCE
uniref:Uncharacterized protein n=1 Tax=Anopheles farauti TaxID=69004 RepID=A0A182QFZ5_9DIPT